MLIPNRQVVTSQYSYVNLYDGEQAEVLKAVLREIEENPGKPKLTWLYFDGTKAEANFRLPKLYQKHHEQQTHHRTRTRISRLLRLANL